MTPKKARPNDSRETPAHAPVLNMRGRKVALGPIRRDLISTYLRWINDFEVTRTLDLPMRPFPLEFEENWYQRMTQSDHDIAFTVYEGKTLRPIGNAGLHQIDHQHRSAEFGMAIGEREFWGKGYGTETTALLLEYGFRNLGLHNIMLRVFANNEAAIRAYQRAGFRPIGVRREARRVSGEVWNILFMDCLSSDQRTG